MTAIHNHTGAPHFWFEKSGPQGEPLDVLVLSARFDLANQGCAITFAKNQGKILLGDEFGGPVASDPLLAVIIKDGDLLPYKPGTDILVYGHAHAPDKHPHHYWTASLQVGNITKNLTLYGPREYHRHGQTWQAGEAKPVVQIALDYRLAYGGSIQLPAHLHAHAPAGLISYPANPAGCGWLPDHAAIAELADPVQDYLHNWIAQQTRIPAPQIEAEHTALIHPCQNFAPEGFGPIARWWQPRVSYQGQYDAQWHQNRAPLLPLDFDSRYYQSAPANQVVTPHLRGDESIIMHGLLPQSATMRLPGWHVIAAIKCTSGEYFISLPLLDTLRIDLDSQTATLVWRTHFTRLDPVDEVTIAFHGGPSPLHTPAVLAPTGEPSP